MQPAERTTTADRARAIRRLRQLTIGTTLAGLTASAMFAGLAAATYTGSSDGTAATTAATVATTDDTAATIDDTAALTADSTATSSSSDSSSTTSTTSSSSTSVGSTSDSAHVSTGGS